MAKNPTAMRVVAAVLSDGAGRWLMQKRPAHKRHGGLWEFPGGKVEPGETPRAALARELAEELTITARQEAMALVARASEPAGGAAPEIVIELYTVAEWHGRPTAEPGAEIGWYTRYEIADLAMPPLDVALARALAQGA